MKRLICAALVLTLIGAPAALARDHHRGHHNNFRSHSIQRSHSVQHSWQRGARFSRFNGDRYAVISDWNRYQLRRPPDGYHWVRSGSDFVLVAIGTGIIADIALSNR